MPELITPQTMLFLWGALGYLLGSIPFGVIIAQTLGLGNLRQIGSGNIGATNVLRTGSKSAAAMTLLLDGGKGAAAVLLARSLATEDAAQLAGGMAFLGHCFPVWLKFRGGKGVATFLGLLLGLAWPVGLAACATWLLTAVLLRMSSFSALMAAASSTVWMVVLGYGHMIALGAVLTLLIFWTHRANISRIRSGEEPKIGQK